VGLDIEQPNKKENLEKVDPEETGCFNSSNTLSNFGTLPARSLDVNKF